MEVLIPDPFNVSRFCVVTNSVSVLAVPSSHFSGVDDGEEALRYRGTATIHLIPIKPPSSILDFSRMSFVSGQAMDPVDTYWKHIPWLPSGNLSASVLMSLASLCKPKRPYASLKWQFKARQDIAGTKDFLMAITDPISRISKHSSDTNSMKLLDVMNR